MFGAMMTGYNKNRLFNKVIYIFNQITNPTAINLTILFNACASMRMRTTEALELVKKTAGKMPKSYYSNPQLVTYLVDALMKCQDTQYAELIFHQMKIKVLPMYGAMMKGYLENNQAEKAIELFHHVPHTDRILFTILFNVCATVKTKEALDLVKTISNRMPHFYYSNNQLATSLLDAVMKCGDVDYAQTLFNKAKTKSTSMFGAMMKGYVHNNQPEREIELFHQTQDPNEIILIILFNACAAVGNRKALNLVKVVSKQMPEAHFCNAKLVTSLLDALMKCGDIEHAEMLFNGLKLRVPSMFGAMMKGYVENNEAVKAIELFHQVKEPDEIIFTILFNACAALRTDKALVLVKSVSQQMPQMYLSNVQLITSLLDCLMKFSDIEYAEMLFNQSKTKSVSMYDAMMNGFNLANDPLKTLNLFNLIKDEGIQGNVGIYLYVIKALSEVGDYTTCELTVNEIPIVLLDDSIVQRTLIDIWGKVGCVAKAENFFERITDKVGIDFAVMVNSYGLNGMGDEAIRLYHSIPSNLLAETVHVCVLNAFSHAGLVAEARSIFQKVENKSEKIYSTMIECLSRGSFFEEALSIIDEYERSHSPVAIMYIAVLSGARNAINTDLSEKIYNRITILFPNTKDVLVAASVLPSNVYSSAVGLSSTTIDGEIDEFRAHDQSHPRSNEIYDENERISKQLIEHGHQYDSSWITRPLNQDETVESVLCGHSERLAIAWNFVANPKATKIQIIKNLSICDRSTKLIALIRQCDIIVRDANRIHHFYKNGKCSCNDYF